MKTIIPMLLVSTILVLVDSQAFANELCLPEFSGPVARYDYRQVVTAEENSANSLLFQCGKEMQKVARNLDKADAAILAVKACALDRAEQAVFACIVFLPSK